MPRYTSAPWEWNEQGELLGKDDGEAVILNLDTFGTPRTAVPIHANQDLLQAASELYEACKALVLAYNAMSDGDLSHGLTNGLFFAARAAVAKAEGQPAES